MIALRTTLIAATALVFLLAGMVSIQALVDKESASDIPVIHSHTTLIADFHDKRTLVGASHHVFTGTVMKQIGTKQHGSLPETQFTVQVLENIKGTLPKVVTVNQQGGLLETDGEVSLVLVNGDPQLIPGESYLFATRYLADEKWHTVIPNFGDIKIEGNVAYEKGNGGKLTLKSDLLAEFRNALANEIVPEVRNGPVLRQ